MVKYARGQNLSTICLYTRCSFNPFLFEPVWELSGWKLHILSVWNGIFSAWEWENTQNIVEAVILSAASVLQKYSWQKETITIILPYHILELQNSQQYDIDLSPSLSPFAVRLTLVCLSRLRRLACWPQRLTHLGFYFSSGWSDTYLSASLLVGPRGLLRRYLTPKQYRFQPHLALVFLQPTVLTSTSSLWLSAISSVLY